jgi:hypothetical protein
LRGLDCERLPIAVKTGNKQETNENKERTKNSVEFVAFLHKKKI